MSDITHEPPIKLTQFSHGYGCGCKIAPAILDQILKGNESDQADNKLLIGNVSRDDAAAYLIGEDLVLLSTTDFFMPIVDDAFTFGQIAACNALSDIYAMGGKPILALAVLGWPVDKLDANLAAQVLSGARSVCKRAGISIAGGHSIDNPEPLFGLAVNGLVAQKNLKANNSAKAGDLLFLTKELGAGIITTAAKKGDVQAEDLQKAIDSMCTLNLIGEILAGHEWVHAMTDITGFGLFGHLLEMAEGSFCSANLYMKQLPLLCNLKPYMDAYHIPAITYRNWNSYGHKIDQQIQADDLHLGCDPQTSGGLLVAVDASRAGEMTQLLKQNGVPDSCLQPIGMLTAEQDVKISIKKNE